MLSTIGTLTDDQLTEDIRTAHHHMTKFKARFLVALGEFVVRELCRGLGAATPAAWLSRECGVSARSAHEYLNVSAKLRKFPLLTSKFLAGELSYSKVRLLLRYLTEDNEEELLELAVGLSYDGLEQQLAGREKTSTSGKNAREYLKFTVCEKTGDVRFWGQLKADRGAELLAALKTGELASLRDMADLPASPEPEVLDQLLDRARETPEAVPGERVSGVGQEPGGAGSPDDGGRPEGGEQSVREDPEPEASDRRPNVTRHGPPLRSRLLQALLGMVGIVRSKPKSQVRAPGAEVQVSVAADGTAALAGHLGAEPRQLHRLLLNSRNQLHVVDDRGVPIKLGRAVRTVSLAQEKLLLAKWMGQCGTPGCVHSHFLEFHHIVSWAEGGETNLDNLIPLCGGCHSMVTAGIIQITVSRRDPTALWFSFPGGVTYLSRVRTTPRRSLEAAPVQGELLSGDSFDDPERDAG